MPTVTINPSRKRPIQITTGGGDVSWDDVTGKPTTFAPIIGSGAAQAVAGNDPRLSDARTPTAHSQAASTISDSTVTGRAVLTAADAAAARTAIGAGTSSFNGAYASLSGLPTLGTVAPLNTNGNAAQYLNGNGAWATPAGGSDPFVLKAFLAADAATGANVTPISLTGFSFSYAANSRYFIDFVGAVRAAATTTGSGFQIDVSTAVTRVGVAFVHQLANTGTLSGGSSIADDASVGVSSGRPSANVDTPVMGSGYLVTGANAGTAQLRYRSEVAAVSTVMAGFMMRVMQL